MTRVLQRVEGERERDNLKNEKVRLMLPEFEFKLGPDA